MKYHGFDSPRDWSQYLIQKADKHEYEPSEPGKRVEALLEKLYLPQNSYSYAKFPQWFADAADKNSKPAIGCFAAAGAFIIMAISLIADIGILDSGLSRETLGALINVAVLMLHIAGGCIVASVACAVWDSNQI